jgi:hypothetical protein
MHFLRLLLAAWLALGILVWLVRVMVSEGQFVFGMYRRHIEDHRLSRPDRQTLRTPAHPDIAM